MSYNNNSQSAANCPTSTPIILSEIELVSFNGFAWSNQGIIHQSSRPDPGPIDQWFGGN